MGYLNSQPGDDDLIAAMGANGTGQVPGPSLFEHTGEAVAQGVAGVADSTVNALTDLGASIHSALPSSVQHVLDWTPFKTEPDWQKDVSQQRENLEKWIDSDKQYQGTGAQVAGGIVKGVGEFALGSAAGGPVGAAALMGGTSADDTYREMRAQGVDDTTAKEAAGVQGVVGAVGAVVPFVGKTLLGKAVSSALTNAGLGIASRAGQAGLLDANGYHDMAQAQRPFDAQQLAIDTLVGAGMGFGAHLHARMVSPADVDVARTVADEMHTHAAAPGIPSNPDAANLHSEIFGRAMDDLDHGRDIRTPTPEEAQRLADGIVADPATMRQQQTSAAIYADDPDVQNAFEMGPKLDEAEKSVDADIPDFQKAEPNREPPAGETSPAQLAPENESMLRQLEAKYGNQTLETDEGRRVSVTELGQQMRQEAADAESNNRLMDAAVSCFARTGSSA